MHISEVMNLDYRIKKNKIKIQKALRKLPPLMKFPEGKMIELIDIENALSYMFSKYDFTIQWISCNSTPEDDLKYTISLKTGLEYIDTIYAIEIYELFAKASILIYDQIKKGKIPKNKQEG